MKSSRLTLGSDGKPFTSEQEARKALKDSGRPQDRYAVVKSNNGWAIIDIAPEAVPADNAPAVPPPVKKYYRVIFSQRQNAMDLPFVQAAPNGEKLVFQRGKEIIISAAHKEAIDHAVMKEYGQSNRPDEPLQVIGNIHRFPYTLVGEATEEEYLAGRRHGSAIQAEVLQRLQTRNANQQGVLV